MHPRSRIFRVSYKLKAFHEAKLTSEPETDNEHDRFVVAGQTILPGTLFPSTKSNYVFSHHDRTAPMYLIVEIKVL